jgi:hypothetical protein
MLIAFTGCLENMPAGMNGLIITALNAEKMN